MTFDEFRRIFNRLYDGCQHPRDSLIERRYKNRQETFWRHYQYVKAEIFDGCVQSYLSGATQNPWFPTLGQVLECGSGWPLDLTDDQIEKASLGKAGTQVQEEIEAVADQKTVSTEDGDRPSVRDRAAVKPES